MNLFLLYLVVARMNRTTVNADVHRQIHPVSPLIPHLYYFSYCLRAEVTSLHFFRYLGPMPLHLGFMGCLEEGASLYFLLSVIPEATVFYFLQSTFYALSSYCHTSIVA